MKYDYGLWPIAAIHAVWLLGFGVAFLRPARRREWRSLGILTGFVVALYVEMFGFPLTIYLLTALLGQFPVAEPFAHLSGNLWATLVLGQWMAGPLMLVGGLIILAGTLVLPVAWKRIYRAQGALVTAGPYAVVRHPQRTVSHHPGRTDAVADDPDGAHGAGPRRGVRPPRLARGA